jgi:hypothetical protein
MNEKIMTWYNPHNNGAYQKNTEYGIFSDLLTVKPTFSFEFTSFNYNETINQFNIDGVDMTEEQKAEVLQAIIDRPVPNEFYINVRTAESKWYLQSTDWYVIRNVETGEPIPADVTQKRAEARILINQIQAEYN